MAKFQTSFDFGANATAAPKNLGKGSKRPRALFGKPTGKATGTANLKAKKGSFGS